MLKSRRRRQSQPVVLEQFLTFIVRQEQFAVPMAQAYRVIPLPRFMVIHSSGGWFGDL